MNLSEIRNAMQLADDLDNEFVDGRISNQTGRRAATELRRLHELNQELLEALKEIAEMFEAKTASEEYLMQTARAVITKVIGGSK